MLLTLGFPKFGWYFFSWVALLPLFVALQGKSSRQAMGLGFVCGLVHYATTLYWIRYVVYYYGGVPWPLAILVLLLLCCYLAVYPAAFALTAHALENRPWLWVLGLPTVWTALEWARAHLLTGFPWAELGYTQTPFIQLVQLADITGVYGVSWLLVLVNASIMACFGRFRLRAALPAALACVAAVTIYGSWRLGMVENLQNQAAAWPVAVVQGNIDQAHKWDPLYQQQTLDRYRNLSIEAVHHTPSPRLIVWPETAAPFFYGIEQALTDQLNGLIGEIGVPVLFGSPAVKIIDGEPRLLNSAYLVDPAGKVEGHYAKRHLVPFGEYVPYQKILFFVHKLVEAAGNFVAGSHSSPMKVDGQNVGVLICYEAIFPELARLAVEQGADCLVNITNDAWFGTSSAPYQHKEMAGWRAIEFRVPLIRSANTGISTFFDATGRSHGTIPLNESGYLEAELHPVRMKTFYAEWGDLFAWLCSFLTLALIVYCGYKGRAR